MTVELNADERRKIIEENSWIPARPPEKEPSEAESRVYPEGHGIYLRGDNGKDYIDATSGYWCTVLGHGNKRVIKAIEEQLEKVQYAPPGHVDVSTKLLQKIAEVAPGDLNRVSLYLHGSDANEAAVATAKAYFGVQGKHNSMIISRFHAYHGQTLGAVALTSLARARKKLTNGLDLATASRGVYPMFAPYCYRCAYRLEYPSCDILCARALEEVVEHMGPDNVAAFMGEPVFGMGGNIAPPDEYWPIIRQICDKHGFLLILDEVITGWGRTGELFACNHWDVVPDVLVTAKGLTAAYLPVSATITRDAVFETFKGHGAAYWGHTHAAYPAGSACAVATIDILMEEKLWEHAAEIGRHIRARLEDICKSSKIVGTVHGLGLMLGLEIVEDKKSKTPSSRITRIITKKLDEKGVLINSSGHGGNILAVAPPMIITKDEADHLCDLLAEAIHETGAMKGLKRGMKRKRVRAA